MAVASPARAQVRERVWERLFDAPTQIWTVHFLELGGPPRIGFIGTNEGVYRTTDGGNTWTQSSVNAPQFAAADFTFKDSLTGWFANYNYSTSTQLPICYKTTDGGLTWNAIYGPTMYASSILYRPENHLLILTSWREAFAPSSGHSLYSTDEGLTWHEYWRDQRLNGLAFLDSNYGIATCAGQLYIRTTDGGLTWDYVNRTGDEAWQPTVITKTGSFYTSSETSGQLFLSTDRGLTFDPIYSLGYTTGTLRTGSCSSLYAQYSIGSAYQHLGVVRSQNGGLTWSSIGGPVNKLDTRLYVKGGYVYVGSIDTLTKSNSLWRYVEDSTFYDGGTFESPQTSDSVVYLVAPDCGTLDSTLGITYLNDCSPAQLISAELSPTTRFLIPLDDSLPVRLSGTYHIPILYSPVNHDGDTATLTLTYRLHGQDVRSTVKIIGSVPGSHTIARFTLSVVGQPSVSSIPGDIVPVDLTLLNDISAALGLDSIAFAITYDDDVASPVGLSINPPWSLLRESQGVGRIDIAFRRTDGEDLLANSTVATFQFKTFLTAKNRTAITTHDFRLNDGDSVYLACTATATDPGSVEYIVRDTCGDPTLRHFMSNLPIVDATSNEIRIRSPHDERIDLVVYDLLGNLALQKQLTSQSDGVRVSLERLRPGTYYGRVTTGTGIIRTVRIVRP